MDRCFTVVWQVHEIWASSYTQEYSQSRKWHLPMKQTMSTKERQVLWVSGTVFFSKIMRTHKHRHYYFPLIFLLLKQIAMDVTCLKIRIASWRTLCNDDMQIREAFFFFQAGNVHRYLFDDKGTVWLILSKRINDNFAHNYFPREQKQKDFLM